MYCDFLFNMGKCDCVLFVVCQGLVYLYLVIVVLVVLFFLVLMKLYFDLVMFIGVDFFFLWFGYEGGLCFVNNWGFQILLGMKFSFGWYCDERD